MQEEKYYNEITSISENVEVNTRVRQIQDNSEKLQAYWNIGKLIVEAQGGENHSKYGDKLIKTWAYIWSKKYGNNYGIRNLFYYRKFYIIYKKVNAVRAELTWTHYKTLLSVKDENARNYYTNLCIINNLSSRELISEIKNKAYDRLSYADKKNIKVINSSNYTLTIKDMIKDPILLKIDKNISSLNEKVIHKYLIDMVESRFLELGMGFTLAGHEYKLVIDNKTYRIDLLFLNYELNAFVVVEIKSHELQSKDISQLEFYVNYIDKNIRKSYQNKTIGLLIVKKNNHYVIEYTTSNDIYVTTYRLIKDNNLMVI